MSEQWAAVENFERSNEIISAVNLLSIHTKLTLAGVEDQVKPNELNKARATLREFFKSFTKIIDEAVNEQQGVFIGSDPQLNQLVKEYLTEQKQFHQKSSLYSIPLAEINQLLESEKPDDKQSLIVCLRELRTLFGNV